MTGQEIFDKIHAAMLERQRMSDSQHLAKYHSPWVRPHNLKLLKADCEAAFGKVAK